MTAYQKLKKLVEDFFVKAPTMENTEDFCNAYMDLYYDLVPEFDDDDDKEVCYLLDDINLVCDSYEKLEALREDYYLDEQQLREKFFPLYEKLIRAAEKRGGQ